MNRKLLCVAALGSLLATPVHGYEYQLGGVIRDFQISHPDMQHVHKHFGVRTGLVESRLGSDGKPVLNAGIDYGLGMIDSPASFNQWYRNTPGVNIAMPFSITLDNGLDGPGGVYSYAVEKPEYFFPIDGRGWGDTATDMNGDRRNFFFTFELQTEFNYTDPAERDYDFVFEFTGDDDVWVFINGHLAVDIGGVHGQAVGEVNLDEQAEALGLEPGGRYTLFFFFAERHTKESNFRIETTIKLDELPPTTVDSVYD